MARTDLTRWNRAGLQRVAYVDGNAATFLARLRAALADAFPDLALPGNPPPDGADASEWRDWMAELYAGDHRDLFWQIQRSFARACHVLAGHVDAVANESWLGTATQWESLRRLVAMLDYSPRPPASASTPLAIEAAGDGMLEAGFAVRHSPADGSAEVVFETLSDLELAVSLNALRAAGYGRNPHRLHGRMLWLEGAWPKLEVGMPLVLENTVTGERVARRITGVWVEDDRTRVEVTPALPRRYRRGDTRVHLLPKDRLAIRGPLTTGAEIGTTLRLDAPPTGISAGDLLAIGSPGHKPVFRYVKTVLDDGLRFHLPVGDLNLLTARISRPEALPVSFHYSRQTQDGNLLLTVLVAGDWRRLCYRWLACHRKDGNVRRPLPVFRVFHANHAPVSGEGDGGNTGDGNGNDVPPGYTALTLAIAKSALAAAGLSESDLGNIQSFLMVPESPGPWRPDPWLERNLDCALPVRIEANKAKKLSAGDFVVLQRKDQQAWGQVRHVETNDTTFITVDRWAHRGGGSFYRSTTDLYGHFTETARPVDWQRNRTPLAGNGVVLDAVPEALVPGRRVLLVSAEDSVFTRVRRIDGARVIFDDELPAGSTVDSLVLYGNVVVAGHGETRPEKLLANTQGGLPGAEYRFDAEDVAFVADSTFDSGVRAAIEVRIGDVTWQPVSHFRDVAPTDEVYAVRMAEDGTLRLVFGARPVPAGIDNLRIAWRQGVGPSGNLPAGSLEEPVRKHHRVAAVHQPQAASGGAEMESAAQIREAAPASVLTLERAVSLRDFGLLARSHSSIDQARAFSRPQAFARREGVDVVVVPAGGGTLGDTLRDELEGWLQAHALPGVTVRVRPFGAVPLWFEITLGVDPARYDQAAVSETVRAELAERFGLARRRLGQPLYRSELYALVEGVTGVTQSDCRIHVKASAAPARVVRGESRIVRLVDPGPRQVAYLESAADVVLTVREVRT